MPITIEHLQQLLSSLVDKRETAIAEINAAQGGIRVVEGLLKVLEAPDPPTSDTKD